MTIQPGNNLFIHQMRLGPRGATFDIECRDCGHREQVTKPTNIQGAARCPKCAGGQTWDQPANPPIC